MKVLLFDGKCKGRKIILAGEYPEEELKELLGGDIETVALSERLALVRRADGWVEALPSRYELHRLGRAPELIPGPCAVVRLDRQGCYRDMNGADAEMAAVYIGRAI